MLFPLTSTSNVTVTVPPVHMLVILPLDPVPAPPTTWADFLASLPLWERSLFPDVTVLDLPALLTALEDNVAFYLASDGGAIPFKGSFGAVIATGDVILAECGGHAQNKL
jgi:hypothetical protein